MDKIDKLLLKEVINFHKIPSGAFSIRKNGVPALKKSTKEIEIVSNESGIDVYIKPNTKNKSVHIPVIISIGNITDAVHNNFYVGENSTVTIIAGCGIHNQTLNKSEHNGTHSFYLKKGSKVKYIEKHYGSGDGKKILNLFLFLVAMQSKFLCSSFSSFHHLSRNQTPIHPRNLYKQYRDGMCEN